MTELKSMHISAFSKNKFFILFCFLFISSSFSQTLTKHVATGKRGMVVSASELASEVGIKILKMGGNAVDAGVAVGFALAVTYPEAGNIGGGGYMIIHLQNGKNTTIDFRERAPLSSTTNMYLDKNGNYIPNLSLEGITSVAVPGSVAGLIYALKHFGSMKLAEIIQPAIDLAERGFLLDEKTAEDFQKNMERFKRYPSSFKIFSKDGKPYKKGDLFIQSDLAKTLQLIKEKGNAGFYEGNTAGLLEKQVKSLGGYISLKDLADYKPIERNPVEGSYRGYKIVAMGPSSSGGIALIEMLNILENYNFSKSGINSAEYIHKLVEAMKFAYADRSKYLGDPDFYNVPIQMLTSKKYAKGLFERINKKPIPANKILVGVNKFANESNETTHYSIYDSEGNAVSVTTTINSWFGSGIIVDGAGFLLNNEMDDFSVKPGVPNQFGLIGSKANSIQPGKRMLSSMSPTIVLKNDKPFLILGSPGGSTIITAVLQVILNTIDFHMNLEHAVLNPRIHNQWLPDKIDYEKSSLAPEVKNELIKMGYKIGEERILGIVEAIEINSDKKEITGVADYRGNGSAIGY